MWLMPNSSANCRAERWSVRIAQNLLCGKQSSPVQRGDKVRIPPHGFHMLAATLNKFVGSLTDL